MFYFSIIILIIYLTKSEYIFIQDFNQTNCRDILHEEYVKLKTCFPIQVKTGNFTEEMYEKYEIDKKTNEIHHNLYHYEVDCTDEHYNHTHTLSKSSPENIVSHIYKFGCNKRITSPYGKKFIRLHDFYFPSTSIKKGWMITTYKKKSDLESTKFCSVEDLARFSFFKMSDATNLTEILMSMEVNMEDIQGGLVEGKCMFLKSDMIDFSSYAAKFKTLEPSNIQDFRIFMQGGFFLGLLLFCEVTLLVLMIVYLRSESQFLSIKMSGEEMPLLSLEDEEETKQKKKIEKRLDMSVMFFFWWVLLVIFVLFSVFFGAFFFWLPFIPFGFFFVFNVNVNVIVYVASTVIEVTSFLLIVSLGFLVVFLQLTRILGTFSSKKKIRMIDIVLLRFVQIAIILDIELYIISYSYNLSYSIYQSIVFLVSDMAEYYWMSIFYYIYSISKSIHLVITFAIIVGFLFFYCGKLLQIKSTRKIKMGKSSVSLNIKSDEVVEDEVKEKYKDYIDF